MLVRRFIGNCQICEGDFKTSPDGTVALHGYKRPGDGSIHGRCPGEGWAAYELGTNRIPLVIDAYKQEAVDIDKRVRRIDAGEVTSFLESGYRGKLKEVTTADPQWKWKILDHRRDLLAKKRRAEEMVVHYQTRLQRWTLRPLREVDEQGRTIEQRQAQEGRKQERAAAKSAKEATAEALRAQRGKILMDRRAILDRAGALIREAAARGDRDAVMAVLMDLGKKKNKPLLDPSFAMAESLAGLKRYGTVPTDLPESVAWDANGVSAGAWEMELRADAALANLGIDYRSDATRRLYNKY